MEIIEYKRSLKISLTWRDIRILICNTIIQYQLFCKWIYRRIYVKVIYFFLSGNK